MILNPNFVMQQQKNVVAQEITSYGEFWWIQVVNPGGSRWWIKLVYPSFGYWSIEVLDPGGSNWWILVDPGVWEAGKELPSSFGDQQ